MVKRYYKWYNSDKAEEEIRKKMNLKRVNKILLIISILIMIISIVVGIIILGFIIFTLNNLPEMLMDGSDISTMIQAFGYMSLTTIVPLVIGGCIIISLIIDGIIWVGYGIVKLTIKLIKEKRWKTFIIMGIVLVIMSLMPIVTRIITTPLLKEDTIGYIAYDYNSSLGYIIHIKENDKYVPYLVLTYNYNKTNNALCLRENVVGGEKGYIEDYNGTIAKDRVYDGWLEMASHVKYEETDVDKYLTGEFLKRFDSKLLNQIYNTELSFSEYGYEKGKYNNYEINRKFFILSLTELNDRSGAYYDHQTKNKMKLKYFNASNKSTINDIGVESPYWTRTSYYASEYYIVGYTGGVTKTGNGAKFGVRPAFTIPNDTKINKIYDRDLMQEIYIFGI